MKQVRDLRVGDILLFKNKESRIITRIENNPHKREPYTTDLDEIKVRGTQGELF